MSVYACSEEGIEQLNHLAEDIYDSLELIEGETASIQSLEDEYEEVLGPHEKTLKKSVEAILSAVKDAWLPAIDIASQLSQVAKKYEDIVSDDPFDSVGSDNSSGGRNDLVWQGDSNNSKRIPSSLGSPVAKELASFGVDGIEYKEGIVDFSPVSKYEIPFDDQEGLYKSIGSMPIGKLMTDDGFKSRDQFNGAIRTVWQGLAKKQLVERLKNDPEFASDFQSRTGINLEAAGSVSGLSKELRRVGLTMHETPDCSRIQLVPTIIHDTFKHSGGTSSMLERLLSGDMHEKYRV